MPESILVTDKQYALDPYQKENLDILKEAVQKSFDAWVVYDGSEGSGKTTMCCTDAYYLGYDDKTKTSKFNIDCIVWTPEQFIAAVNKAEEGTPIVWDEFVLAGLSMDAMTIMQKTLIKFSTTIRKKRLFILLIIPYVFMLQKYFALGRPRALIHVVTKGLNRGYFKFYDKEQIKRIYYYGKDTWEYPKNADCAFEGRYHVKSISEIGIDVAEYERRKDKAILSIDTQKAKSEDRYKEMFLRLAQYGRDKLGLSYEGLIQDVKLPLTKNALNLLISRNNAKDLQDQFKAERAKEEGSVMPYERLKESEEVE